MDIVAFKETELYKIDDMTSPSIHGKLRIKLLYTDSTQVIFIQRK
jgi:hypothetical protein